jgi:hypothetical protein
LAELAAKFRRDRDSGARMGDILRAIPPGWLLVAAVFFVRYDYSYEHDGFWEPFLRQLGLPFTQGNYQAMTRRMENDFRVLGLRQPAGGFRYVSPLIFHCVLPNDSILRFADILAHQERRWSYWASADTDSVLEFLRSRHHLPRHMQRLVEHEGDLIAGLFCDVCDHLATGRADAGGGNALDVPAIAAKVLEAVAANEPGERGGRLPTAAEWFIPRPSWVWRRSDSRICLRIPRMQLGGDPGTHIHAVIRKVGHDFPLSVNPETHVADSICIDAWFFDWEAEGELLELVIDGASRASKRVQILDRRLPMVELNGVLTVFSERIKAPARARWLLPEGVVPAEGITRVINDVPPFPLTHWRAGLFESEGAERWIFRRNTMGGDSVEYGCVVERQPNWMLRLDAEVSFLETESHPGPVMAGWPEIELLGEGWLDEMVCEVTNLSTGRTDCHRILDVATREDGIRLLAHDRIASGVGVHGCFRLKVKTANFRSVMSCRVISYSVAPFASVSAPAFSLPGDEECTIEATLADGVDACGIRCPGGGIRHEDGSLVRMTWPVGVNMAMSFNELGGAAAERWHPAHLLGD